MNRFKSRQNFQKCSKIILVFYHFQIVQDILPWRKTHNTQIQSALISPHVQRDLNKEYFKPPLFWITEIINNPSFCTNTVEPKIIAK